MKDNKRYLDFTDGPAISDTNGNLYSSAEMDTVMRNRLEVIFEKAPNLFPPIIKSVGDIKE